MTVTVVVADDDPLVRSGVAMLLRSAADTEVVGEAADGAAAVALARDRRPDVVLMDLRMPGTDGIAATRALTAERAEDPDLLTRVLVLTTFHDDDAVHGALRAGASGYLLKHTAPTDLVPAVRRVAAGDSWLDPAVAGRVIAALARTDPDHDDPDEQLSRLTAREREVLTLMAHGRSNDEIAAGLVLSGATVRTHVNRILMKTGTGNRTNAVILAFRSGLVDPRR